MNESIWKRNAEWSFKEAVAFSFLSIILGIFIGIVIGLIIYPLLN